MNEIRRALTGHPHTPVLTFKRDYPTSPADLQAACTDPERLARWLGVISGPASTVGDCFTLELADEADLARCRVRSCEPDGFAIDWTWPGEADSIIEVRFEPTPGGTTLTLVHGLAEPRVASSYGEAWDQLLGSLARSLGEATPPATPEAQPWNLMTRAPLQIDCDLTAPIEQVWSAFATESGLRTWWWTHWTDVDIEADVRVDGGYRISAPARGIELTGTYLRVEPMSQLAFTWCWRDWAGSTVDEAVDVRFESVAEGTRISLLHSGPWLDDAPAGAYRQGWSFTLQQLRAALDARPRFR